MVVICASVWFIGSPLAAVDTGTLAAIDTGILAAIDTGTLAAIDTCQC
jgi:hypothetical protein